MLIRRCYAGLDADGLRAEVLARLRGVLTVDAAFFATVDPAPVLFTSAYADEPLRAVTEQFMANEFGQDDVNKFAVFAGGTDRVRSLGQATRASPTTRSSWYVDSRRTWAKDCAKPCGDRRPSRALRPASGLVSWCWMRGCGRSR